MARDKLVANQQVISVMLNESVTLSAPPSGASQEKQFWRQSGKFSTPMEDDFQREVERLRRRRIERTGIAAIIIYGAFALSDQVMVPDVYLMAWAIRFIIVVPVMLVSTVFYRHFKSAGARELALALCTIITGASLPVIAALSSHPNAVHYQTGITLVVLFGNIILNQRLRSAVATSVILGVLYAFSLHAMRGMSAPIALSNWMFFFAAVSISLFACVRMDQDRRRAYLAHCREEERNAQLSEAVAKLERLSVQDTLTQLYNRREFDRRFALEWGRARRDLAPLALVIVDVDCFKPFNDNYGHPAGDTCLRKVAEALSSVPRRSSDLVARFGGEEFVVLLPETALEEAGKIAERMRIAVLQLQIPHAHSPVAAVVTASFGVAAMVPTAGMREADLLAAADGALYRAKAEGRNRVNGIVAA
ncbi:GGDEF domain-containing protein [Noviherbaspirillum galbum]|uniref:diguanylate cyclase n=1 Tax=Noviherbaspirillum galbum TaxID=2709383 RepID=A0A6B3SQS3_9BURK|nr:diguanylate cyclase [Noviherbaspirillum galbum]NEX63270.1 GGDEF domain-containing protein [Noviherbaspirillum galbum]